MRQAQCLPTPPSWPEPSISLQKLQPSRSVSTLPYIRMLMPLQGFQDSITFLNALTPFRPCEIGDTDAQVRVRKVKLRAKWSCLSPGLLHATSGSRYTSDVYSLLFPLPPLFWNICSFMSITMFFEGSIYPQNEDFRTELSLGYIIHGKLAILRLFKTV